MAGERFSGFETRRYTKSGGIIPVSISGGTYNDENDRIAGAIITLTYASAVFKQVRAESRSRRGRLQPRLTVLILTPATEALHFAAGFNWRHALVFGALISATDPIAVVGIFKSLGVPKRLGVLLDGESLLNDGTAVVFFTLSLSLVAGAAVHVGGLALDFVSIVGFGGLIGTAIGLAVSQIIRRVDDADG